MIATRRGLTLTACLFGLVAGLAGVACAAGEPLPLHVCIQGNDPPLSSHQGGRAQGFDVALSQLIAARLDRPLAIQWFTTRRDPDSNPVAGADALLSDGHCQLLAGYPLMADALGRPRAPTAKLPPFEGARPEDRGRWVKLGELAASRPYRFDALAVVLSPAVAGRTVHKLADLDSLKVGVEQHSLADLIAMDYGQGRLADTVVHFPDANALFQQLQAGTLDAGFVDLHQFDAWRQQHPETHIIASGYTHSIGFNIGFVGLAESQALIARVDGILSDVMSQSALSRAAGANGLTYLPPRSPEIAPSIPLAQLAGD